MGRQKVISMAKAISAVVVIALVVQGSHASTQEASLSFGSDLQLLSIEDSAAPGAQTADGSPAPTQRQQKDQSGMHKQVVDTLKKPEPSDEPADVALVSPIEAAKPKVNATEYEAETKRQVVQAFEATKKTTDASLVPLGINQKHLATSINKLQKSQETMKQFMITDVPVVPDAQAKNATNESENTKDELKKSQEKLQRSQENLKQFKLENGAEPAESVIDSDVAQQTTADAVKSAETETKALEKLAKAKRLQTEAKEEVKREERKVERTKARAARAVQRAETRKAEQVAEVKTAQKKETEQVKRQAKRDKAQMARKLVRAKKEEKRKVESVKATLEQKVALMTKKSEEAVNAANARAAALKTQLDIELSKNAAKAKPRVAQQVVNNSSKPV